MKVRKNLRRLLAVVLALSMTMSLLTVTAFADEEIPVCGKEEHVHTQECYEKALVCGLEEPEPDPEPEPEPEPDPEPEPEPEPLPQIMPGFFEMPGIGEPREPAADAPETDAPETDAPETDEPGSEDTPAGDVPLTGAPAVTVPDEIDPGMSVDPGDAPDAGEPEAGESGPTGPEAQPHFHGDGCYELRLVCGKEEHTHTQKCFRSLELASPADEIQNDGIMTIAAGGLPTRGDLAADEYDLGGGTVPLEGPLKIRNGTVTIKNGTVNAQGNGSAIIVFGGTLVLENVTVTGGTGTKIWRNGTTTEGNKVYGNYYVGDEKEFIKDYWNINGFGSAIGDYVAGNKDATTTYGGGILVVNSGKLEIKGNSSIENNTANMGGGICSFISSTVNVYGGVICGNTADIYGGGGMWLGGKNNRIYPTDGDIYICNNTTETLVDLGGGGVFQTNNGTLSIQNAVIYDNTAYGLGGGIGGCLHGSVSVVNPDTAAIYGNTATGEHRLSDTKNGGTDRSGSFVDWSSLIGHADDYFVAGWSRLGPETLGGGYANWVGRAIDSKGAAAREVNGGMIEVLDGLLGLSVLNDDEVEAAANANNAKKTYIYDNVSYMHGGGIGTNGMLIFGIEDERQLWSDNSLTIKAGKMVEVPVLDEDAHVNESPEGYTFELVKDERVIATAKSDAQGNIIFPNLPTTALFGKGNAQSLNVTLFLREKAGDELSMEYDGSKKTIQITGSRNTWEENSTFGPNTAEEGQPYKGKFELKIYHITDTVNTVTVNGEPTEFADNTITLPENTFVNRYLTGGLKIKKEITGAAPGLYEDKEFHFTVVGPDGFTKSVTVTGAGEADISGLPIGDYTITETGDTSIEGFNWLSSSVSSGSVTVTNGQTAEFTAVNNYKLKEIDLSIRKLLELNSAADGDNVAEKYLDHRFTFSLYGTDINGNKVTWAGVRLRAGELGVFAGVPAGTYTIIESDYEIPDFAYQGVTVEGGSINDLDDNNHTVTFTLTGSEVNANITFTATNSYDVNRANLRITKVVTLDGKAPGEANPDNVQYVEGQTFTFKITGKDPNGNAVIFDNQSAERTVNVTVGPDGTGARMLVNLPIGTYEITELDTDISHYDFDGVTFTSNQGTVSQDGKTVTLDLIEKNVTETVEFTAANNYTVKRTNLSLEKAVRLNGQENNGHELIRDLVFVFEVDGVGLNGEEVHAVLDLRAENGWKRTWSNIPVGAYTVREVSAPDVRYFHYTGLGFTVNGQSVQPEDGAVTLTDNDTMAVVAANSYDINKTSFTVSKRILAGGEGINSANTVYLDHQFTFTLELIEAADGLSEWSSKTVSIGPGQSGAFENLPVGTYRLTESGAAVSDYTFNGVTFDNGKVTPNGDGSFTVRLSDEENNSGVNVTAVNSYTLNSASFTLTKKVELDGKELGDGAEELRGVLFGFTVTGADFNGVAHEQFVTVAAGGTVTVTLPHGVYTVTEVNSGLANYENHKLTFTGSDGVTVTGDGSVTVALTDESMNGAVEIAAVNTYTRKLDSINIRKLITGNNADIRSLWDFTVAMRVPADYVELAGSYAYTVTGEDGGPAMTAGAEGAETPKAGTVSVLRNEDGTPVTVEIDGLEYVVYGVVEKLGNDETAHIAGVPVGVLYKVTELQENQGGYITEYSDRKNGMGIVEENGENLTVVQNSNDIYTYISVTKTWANDRPSQRPGSITAALYKNGVLYETFELSAANNWTRNWGFMEYGAEYTVEELNVPAGYVASYSGIFRGTVVNITITNTSQQDYTSYSVRKVWQGDDAATRPAGITVQLMADGAPYGQSVTLNAANGWAHTWTGLDAETDYTVAELDVPEGYVSSGAANGREYVITNTWGPRTEVTVSKVWLEADGSETDMDLPDAITVSLYNNGQLISSVVLSEDTGWAYTWTGLDAAGSYTVEETAVEGWTGSVSRDGNAFVLTNVRDDTFFEFEEPDTPLSGRPFDEELTEIPDDEVPLDYMPSTGDDGALAFWLAMAALSGTGLLLTAFAPRRRGEEDPEGEEE